ncbi:hypothetical protein LGH82_07425 [Mesorhizobium sp. PAMC28654]|uniref:hypothetical protein n=1 Tax=Mesorhizobium sp. PAMC28654 TaxID=2880934 RepID=UPI001D09D6A5|nr:hypothetical protein [Mesorhizobium sp. PAMC28654]UDL92979.1 hypothetical protein LGH82_07425 [Mesorhizobium sp. PAMC28654]
MARATMPMFSPSCGSTKMMAGPADGMVVASSVAGMIINELLFAAFQRSLPYSGVKMKHSQMTTVLAANS